MLLPRLNFSDDWTLGKPDLVLEMGEDFRVPASRPGHLSLLRHSYATYAETSMSRRSSIGRVIVGSLIT